MLIGTVLLLLHPFRNANDLVINSDMRVIVEPLSDPKQHGHNGEAGRRLSS